MSKDELVMLINTCFEAVDSSKIGPIFTTDKDGNKVMNQIPYNTFLYLINNMAPRNLGDIKMTVKEPNEGWKNNE